MYEASFESVLKTILVILLIYFAFKMLIKWFGPVILKYILKKVGAKFQQQFTGKPPSSKRRKKSVIIENKPSNDRKSNKKVGEYIDYEEID